MKRLYLFVLLGIVACGVLGCDTTEPSGSGLAPLRVGCGSNEREVLVDMHSNQGTNWGWDGRICAEFVSEDDIGACKIVNWNFPDREGSDTFFRFQTGHAGCWKNFELWVRKFGGHGNLGIFDGEWIRPFDSGSGPFATGTYRVAHEDRLLDEGTFDFYEREEVFPSAP